MADLPSAVVVAYGADALLDDCLTTLRHGPSVVVVDNASSQVTEAISLRHGATYVDAGSNLGFAGGVNVGLRHLDGDADVLLLNPDARLSRDDLRALARRLAAAPRTACVAPAQRHPETGNEQRVAWPFPSPGRQWLVALGLGRHLRQRDFLIGSALLISREALRDVGPLDERYFLYCEETDWQRRAAERGWRVELVPDVIVKHVGAGTSSDSALREAYFHAGHELYIRKWFGRRGWWLYRAGCLGGDAVRAATGGERAQAARARFRIYREGPLRHRDRLLAKKAG